MAWHWYFTSALPRSLLGALPLCLLGALLERRICSFLVATVAVVVAFSALGHKEVCACGRPCLCILLASIRNAEIFECICFCVNVDSAVGTKAVFLP
jgi:hypothetical protein